jgi:hypothetical protein
MLSLLTKYKTLTKVKVFLFSLFVGFFLVGCGGAEAPEITTQPKSRVVTADREATLQVAAEVSDGGVLVYQWYSNTIDSNEGGTALEGENSDTLTVTAPSEGAAYYYVVVSNINANLTAYANTTSDVSVITVVDYEVYEVSFYDADLNLLHVEVVKGGEVVKPSKLYNYSNVWYPINSAEAAEESYIVNSDLAFFAVGSVREITTPDELSAIRNDLNGKYVLKNSIDLSGINWVPIGNKSAPFTGRLNGRLRLIKGLTVDAPNSDYVGLFGSLSGGHVLALRLDVDRIVGRDYVGGLAGRAALISTITAVTVTGEEVKGNKYVGGIVGDVHTGTITATYSTVDVTATGDYVGGIVGDIDVGTITATFVKGNVKSTGDYVGGAAGSATLSTITATFSLGNVKTNGDYVGGVAGYSTLSTVTASFVYGNIEGDDYVGGIVGRLRLGTVVATFLHGRAYGDRRVDGIVGGNLLGVSIANFADGLGFLVW